MFRSISARVWFTLFRLGTFDPVYCTQPNPYRYWVQDTADGNIERMAERSLMLRLEHLLFNVL